MLLSARSRRAFPSVRPTLACRVCGGTGLCRREVVVDQPFSYFRDRSTLRKYQPSRLDRCTRGLSRAHAFWLSLDLQPASRPIPQLTVVLRGGLFFIDGDRLTLLESNPVKYTFLVTSYRMYRVCRFLGLSCFRIRCLCVRMHLEFISPPVGIRPFMVPRPIHFVFFFFLPPPPDSSECAR